MIGAAAGIARKSAKVLHGAVLPQERMRSRTGVRNADDGAKIVDPMRFTGCAAKRAQILKVPAEPQSCVYAGTARDLAGIVDSKRGTGVCAR